MKPTNSEQYPHAYRKQVESYLEYLGYPDVLYALYEEDMPHQDIAELIVIVSKQAHDEKLSARRAALDIFGMTCLFYGYQKMMENVTIQ